MLNVLIAEDNMQISVHLSNSINTPNVRCIGILNEGSKVYEKIKELKPDILLLDLKMPGKNGLEILKEIEEDKKIKTRVYIYSGDAKYISRARDFDCVERFYTKNTPPEEIGRQLKNESKYSSPENTRKEVSEILFKLGFTYSLEGTKLITDCIMYSIEKNENKIKKIYDYIARINKKNTHTIKSDINTAVNNMWRFTDRKKTRRILRLGETDKPSSKNVITMVKYYIAA